MVVQKGKLCNHSKDGTLLNIVLFVHPIMNLGASSYYISGLTACEIRICQQV